MQAERLKPGSDPQMRVRLEVKNSF